MMQESQGTPNPKDADTFHSEVEIKGTSSDGEARDAFDGDEDQLARLGKKQVLKVRARRLRLYVAAILTNLAELQLLVDIGF